MMGCMLPVQSKTMYLKPSLTCTTGGMKRHLRVWEKHNSVQAVGMDDLKSFKIILQAVSHQQCLCRHNLTHLTLYVGQRCGNASQSLCSDARVLGIVICDGIVWQYKFI